MPSLGEEVSPLAHAPQNQLMAPLGWAFLGLSALESARLLVPPQTGSPAWILATAAGLLPAFGLWLLGCALILNFPAERIAWWRLQLHRALHWLCLCASFGLLVLAPIIGYSTNKASTILESAFQTANSRGLTETSAISETLRAAPTEKELRLAAEFLNLASEFDNRLRDFPDESLIQRRDWLNAILVSSHSQFVSSASDILAERRLELYRDSFLRALASLVLAAAAAVLFARTRHLAEEHVPSERAEHETAHD